MNLIIRGFMVISHYFATPFPPGPLLTNVVFSKDLKLFDKIVFVVFENVNCVLVQVACTNIDSKAMIGILKLSIFI